MLYFVLGFTVFFNSFVVSTKDIFEIFTHILKICMTNVVHISFRTLIALNIKYFPSFTSHTNSNVPLRLGVWRSVGSYAGIPDDTFLLHPKTRLAHQRALERCS